MNLVAHYSQISGDTPVCASIAACSSSSIKAAQRQNKGRTKAEQKQQPPRQPERPALLFCRAPATPGLSAKNNKPGPCRKDIVLVATCQFFHAKPCVSLAKPRALLAKPRVLLAKPRYWQALPLPKHDKALNAGKLDPNGHF